LTNVPDMFLILKESISFQSASLLSVFGIYILFPPLLKIIFSGNIGGKVFCAFGISVFEQPLFLSSLNVRLN